MAINLIKDNQIFTFEYKFKVDAGEVIQNATITPDIPYGLSISSAYYFLEGSPSDTTPVVTTPTDIPLGNLGAGCYVVRVRYIVSDSGVVACPINFLSDFTYDNCEGPVNQFQSYSDCDSCSSLSECLQNSVTPTVYSNNVGSAYDPSNPPTAPSSLPISCYPGDKVFDVYACGNIVIWDLDSVCNATLNSVSSPYEDKFSINTLVGDPSTIFADTDNPTSAEVQAWAQANLGLCDRLNGSIVTYFVDGSADDPDFVWVLNNGSELITESLRRNFQENVSYVTPTGNDTAHIKGYATKPSATYNNWKNDAGFTDGDLIYVNPGTYVVDATQAATTTELGSRDGIVRYQMAPGVLFDVSAGTATDGVLGLYDFSEFTATSATESTLEVRGHAKIDWVSPDTGNDVLLGVYEHNSKIKMEFDEITASGLNFISQFVAKEAHLDIKRVETEGTVFAPVGPDSGTEYRMSHYYNIDDLYHSEAKTAPMRLSGIFPGFSSINYNIKNWYIDDSGDGRDGLLIANDAADNTDPFSFNLNVGHAVGRFATSSALADFEISSVNMDGGFIGFGGDSVTRSNWNATFYVGSLDWDLPAIQFRQSRFSDSRLHFEMPNVVTRTQPCINFGGPILTNDTLVTITGNFETKGNQPCVIIGHGSTDQDGTGIIKFQNCVLKTTAVGKACVQIAGTTPTTGATHIHLVFENCTFITDGSAAAIEVDTGGTGYEIVVKNCYTNSSTALSGGPVMLVDSITTDADVL